MKKLFLTFFMVLFYNFGTANERESALVPTATISGNATVCQNAPSPVITFTGSGGTAPYTFTYTLNGNPQTDIVTVSGNSVTLNAPTGTVGTFSYTLVSVNDSTNNPQNQNGSIVVTVNNLPIIPVISSNGNTTFCQDGNVILSTPNVLNNSYQWNLNGIPIPNATNINYSASSGGNYTVTTTNLNGCSSTSTVLNVTVHPKIEPVLGANGSTEASVFQNLNYFTRCITANSGIINIVNQTLNQSQVSSYSINWGDMSPILTLTNFSTNQTHSYNQGFYTLTISLTTNSGCTYNRNYGIFVGNTPSGSLGNPGNLSGCAPKTIEFPIIAPPGNVPGTQYIIDFGDGESVTYIHPNAPPSVSHTYNTTSCASSSGSNPNSFVATMTITNPCFPPAVTTVGPIIINTPPTPNFTINPNPGCINTNVNLLNTSNAGFIIGQSGCISSPSLYWTIVPSTGWTANNLGNNGGNANDIDSWSNGVNAPSINFNTAGNYTISLFIGNSCEIKTISKTICIEPPLAPTFALNTTNGCAPLSVTATNTTNTTNSCNTPTYLWQVTHTPLYCANTTVAIPNQTSANANFNFVESGSYLIRLTMTNSCGTFNSTQTVIVKKPPTASIAALSSFCGSATINPVATVTNCAPSGSTLTYAWSFPGGNPSTSTSPNPGPINYPSAGNYTVSLIVTNECGASNTASQTLVINQSPVITNTNLSQTICSGTATTPVNITTNPATATFSWTATATAGISGFTPSGTTSTIPAQTISTTNTNPGTVTYVITPTIGTCVGTSVNYIITVNPAAQVNQPAAVTVCNGNTVTPNSFTTSNTTAGTTYSWTNSNTGIGLAASGNGNIPTFAAVNATNTPINTTITVTPSFSGGSAICSGVSRTFIITVNPTGQVNQPTNQVVCNNTATTAVNFSTTNTNGTTSYAWSFDTNIGSTLTGTGNIPSFTAINTGTTPITAIVTVTPTFTNGTTNCIGTAKTFTITVNPSGQVDQPSNQIVCNNSNTSAVNFTTTNTGGTTTYNWSFSTNIGLTPLTGTGNIPSFTTLNTGTTPIIATITVTPTYNGSSICIGIPKTFTITVNPSSQVNQPSNQVVCNNSNTSAINFVTTNTGGTTSYAWSFSTNIGLTPLTGTGNIPSFTAINTGTTPILATITVTPTFTNGTASCIGTAKTFTITVNPSAQVNPIPNQTLCSNSSTTAINFSSNNTGGITTYNWTNSNASIGLPISGTGNINAFNVSNSTANPITATIIVTPSFSNGTPSCTGPSQTFTITVNPSPAVNFSPSNQTICSGETSALVNLSSTTPGATFSWTAVQPTGITGVITSGTNTIPAQNLVNSTNAPITIIYVALAVTTGGNTCAGITYNYTITVNPKPSITENFAEAICSGESFSITPSNSTLNSIPTGTTYSWSVPIVTGGITGGTSATNQTSISGTLVNPTNIVQTATYTVTPRANGCAGNTFTVVISVNPNPVIANVTHPAICSENAFTVIPTNGSGNIVPTGTTYTWTISNNSNITGASASSTPGITTISQTLTNTTNTAQTIVYTVTPTSGDVGNCVGNTFTISVVVNPKPLVLATTQTICSGTSFTATPTNGSGNSVPSTTTYTWTTPISSPSGAITGSLAQATGLNTISQTLTNTTTTPATIEYTVTPTSGACTGTPFTINIIVNPTPTTLGLNNQTYCNGINTSEIVFNNAVAGTTYSWTNSNTAIGLAASGNGNIPVFTPINNGTAPITATISVIATANGCSRVAETFTIKVNPSPAVTFSPTNQTICSGETSALVNLSSTTPGATFSWTAVQPTGITGVITSGTNTIPTQNLVNSTNTPITIIYVAVAVTTGGNTCAGITYNYAITVNPKPSITENFGEAICSGGNFSITPLNSTLNSIPVGTTYSWSAPIVTGGITSGTSAINQTSISGSLVNPTNIVQNATYTVTPRANGCAGNTFTVVISVNPKPVIANVTHPAICSETAFTVTPANGSGNIIPVGTTYTWTVSNNPNITGASDSNATGISTISQTLTNSSNIAQTIVYTVTPTSGDTGNCVGDTFTITVVVNPKPFIQNSTQTICSGTAFDATPTNGSGNSVPNTTTYTWTTPVSTPAGAITSGSAQATGVNTISQTLTNTTTEVATIEYTVTPMAGTCAGIPFIITVTVNPTPTTLGLTNQTYCNAIPTNEIVLNNSVSGTSYTWTNSNTAIGLPASGTGNIPVFTPTNNGTATITATISVIATANGCSRVAETFTITVNPSPVVNFSPANQTICSGDISAVVTLSSTTPGATFSWTATQPSGITGVATSSTNTIPGQTLVNTTNAPIDVTYTAVAATNDTSACAGSSFTYTITVNPRPNITEAFAEAICSGGTFAITPANSVSNSIPSGTTYSWGVPVVSGGITGGASATNQTTIGGNLINPTNTVQTATYTVTPSFNGCAGDTFTVIISVNPKPVIANVTHPAICSETAFTVTPANGSGNIIPVGTTYTWTVSNNPNITGASDSNATGISTISQTLTNSSNIAQTIVYTITPTSGDTGNCVGDTFTITVVVNPKPFIQNSTQTICSGTAFDATPTNGSGNNVPTGTTYTWTISNNPNITGASASATGISTISQTLTNLSTIPQTIEYIITPTANSCSGNTFTLTITVNPTPTTLGLTNQTYCNGINSTEIVFTNVVAGTTYTWTNSNTAIGLVASGNGNIPVFTPINGGITPITAIISVIATANGCARTAETFTVTVNPSPVVNFSPTNQTICSEDTSAVVTLSSTTPGATLSWTATQPSGITGVATSGTNTIPAQTLVNTTNAPIIVTYTAVAATNDTSACAGSSFTYTITVNPKPSIENQSFIICSEERFTVTPVNGVPDANTIVPSGTTYNWVISNNPNISGASSGTGNQINQVLTNNSTSIQTILYSVTPIADICTGNPFTITIEVYPRPDVTFDLPIQTICNETNTSLVTLNSSLPGNITYNWTATIPTGITGALSSGTNTIPVQTLRNTTNAPLTITYSATATFNNNGSSCEGNVYTYSITVNPTFTSSGVVSNYNGYNVSVFGANDGSINLTTVGGSGTYTYSWTGPNGYTSTNEDVSGLFAGTYTVTINDGYCAPIILTFTLTQPPELLIQPDLNLTINLICFGNNNGSVGVLITQESVPPYDYELYNSSGILVSSIIDSTNLNPQFTGLIAGIYSLTVIDANGGRKTVTGLTLTQPNDIVITATTTPITCYGANNASITLTVTGGTGPYQAQWDNLATGFYQNNLAAGNYSILVTDNNGCTKTIVVNIPEAPIFTINPVVVNISCNGANDGSINLNLVGGIQPISLTWSDGSTAGLVRNNLVAGTYTVTIIDSKPCTIVRTFIIVEPQPLVLSANIQNALDCNNANSGAINLLVSGGTPPFTYSWTNGTRTEDLINIPSGNYSVVVTDSRGCTKTAQYSVNRPLPLTLNVETDTNVNCETREISQIFEAQVSGGVPPIQLNWSSGTVSGSNNEYMTTDQDGLVVLTATDALGCTTTYSLNVDIPVLGNASFNQNSNGYTTYGIYSILDPIQFTNTATGDYVSILWNFGDGTFSNEENPIHTYVLEGDYVVTQTVTYPFGCVYVHTISLLVEKGYLLVVPTAFTPNNDSLNDTYRPVTKGLKNVRLTIYDTWGSLIYSETGDVLRGWDGTIKGVNAENGNYHCKVSADTFYGSIIEAEETFVLIK